MHGQGHHHLAMAVIKMETFFPEQLQMMNEEQWNGWKLIGDESDI